MKVITWHCVIFIISLLVTSRGKSEATLTVALTVVNTCLDKIDEEGKGGASGMITLNDYQYIHN
jgi:hypothetical protein